jgi:hypothetical protein
VGLVLGGGGGGGGGGVSAYGPRSNVLYTGCVFGSGKSTAGVLPIADSMNSLQIWVGKVGPETVIPCTSSMGISPEAYPIHTDVASVGVYPQNQASALFSVVPVLPADGRPK